jgi:NAD(P)-dependent dehydrogenase (short-subunit alcohol dehydrogenase family)
MSRKPLSTLLLLVFPGLASAENMGPVSGFVLALGKAVLRQGHRVVIAALNTAAVQDLADPFPHTAIVAALDSTKPDDIARIVQEAKDRFGSVDVLVNTTGVGYIPAVEEGNREGISRQIDINFSDLTAT